jgi:S-adenosylmethionine/arginine decarboxylase-like enzyme
LDNSHNHLHFICTGYINEAPNETGVQFLNDWFRRLVEAIDMKVLIEPNSIYCGTEGNEGLTGLVCIETSHSSIHFWSHPKPFFKFDLYSCKVFDEQRVIELLREFGMYHVVYTTIDRNNDFNPVIRSGQIFFD